MNAATTTTTATSAPMTPELTPRRPVWIARWLPVHSPPSQSPQCCARGGVLGWGGAAYESFGCGAVELVFGGFGLAMTVLQVLGHIGVVTLGVVRSV